ALGLVLSIAAVAHDARGAAMAAECQPPLSVGFRVVRVDRLSVGVWYPTADRENDYTYAKDVKGRARKDGAVAACTGVPLVVFSHGFGGCGTQSVFFTEELARHGYIVAAPD